MVKLEKYDGSKTYLFPNLEVATPEKVLEKFPGILTFTHVIRTDPNSQMFYAIENLSALRSRNGIDDSLSEDEAITKLNEIINTPNTSTPEPTAEERIAAALEFQNLQSL